MLLPLPRPVHYALNSASRHARDLLLWIPCLTGGRNSRVYDLGRRREHGVGANWGSAEDMYTASLSAAGSDPVPFNGLNGSSVGDTVVNWSSPSAQLRDLPTTYDFSVASWFIDGSFDSDHVLWSWGGSDIIAYYPNDSAGDSGPRLFWSELGGNIIDPSLGEFTGELHWDVFVSRASNDHELYRDGVLIGTSTDTGTAGSFSTFHYMAFDDQNFEGWASDLRVYSRALSSAEVFDMYYDPWNLYLDLGERDLSFRVPVAPPAGGAELLQIPHHQRGGFNPMHGGFSA